MKVKRIAILLCEPHYEKGVSEGILRKISDHLENYNDLVPVLSLIDITLASDAGQPFSSVVLIVPVIGDTVSIEFDPDKLIEGSIGFTLNDEINPTFYFCNDKFEVISDNY